jgi:hypothetical protein
VSVCSHQDHQRDFAKIELKAIKKPLSVITGHKVEVLGEITVNVRIS